MALKNIETMKGFANSNEPCIIFESFLELGIVGLISTYKRLD